MNIELDPVADALYIKFNENEILESEQVQPGIVLDFDDAGKVVGIEVLSISKRAAPPARSE